MKFKLILSLCLSFVFTMFLGLTVGSAALGFALFAAGALFQLANPVGAAAFIICGTIAANQAPDCSNPLTGGADDVLYLYNFADITGYDLNVSNPLVIEAINMDGVKKGFSYTGQNFSTQPRWRMVKGPFANVYEHEVEFLVFNYTGAVKKELEALAKGKIVAVVQHNFRGAAGAAAFHAYGTEAGLFGEIMEQDPNSDIQGAVRVMLKTNPKAYEGHIPKSIFDTDYATTKAMIVATITA